jgi:uncharacterized protein
VSTIDIRQHEAEGRGAFFVERDGERVAELRYTRNGERLVTAEHTEVGDVLRGMGVARKLVDALVGWARETGTHVTPQCAYVRAQAEKDASIRDVIG